MAVFIFAVAASVIFVWQRPARSTLAIPVHGKKSNLCFSLLRINSFDGNNPVAIFHTHENNTLRIAFVNVDIGGRHADENAAVFYEHHVVFVGDNGNARDAAGLCGDVVILQPLAASLLRAALLLKGIICGIYPKRHFK